MSFVLSLYSHVRSLNTNTTRGSGFLRRWMAYLEEHADLRYPNAAELYEGD